MNRGFRILIAVVLLLGLSTEVRAQAARQIKVVVNFTQSGAAGQETIGRSGGVVVTRKSVGPEGRFAVEDKRITGQRSSGIFTLVQDGGESSMLVATRVAYTDVAYYQSYLTGAGYFASRLVFREVGTALRVQADILPQNQIRLRLMPRISYFSADGAGLIDVTEAITEIIVPSGQSVALGGATAQMHEVTRRILGYDERRGASETAIAVTATIQ